jgi:hypothetical protein
MSHIVMLILAVYALFGAAIAWALVHGARDG